MCPSVPVSGARINDYAELRRGVNFAYNFLFNHTRTATRTHDRNDTSTRTRTRI